MVCRVGAPILGVTAGTIGGTRTTMRPVTEIDALAARLAADSRSVARRAAQMPAFLRAESAQSSAHEPDTLPSSTTPGRIDTSTA